MAQALGLRVAEASGSIQIKTVLRGGAAERAGFAAGDEWLGLEVGRGKSAQGWRLMRLDELAMFAAAGRIGDGPGVARPAPAAAAAASAQGR